MPPNVSRRAPAMPKWPRCWSAQRPSRSLSEAGAVRAPGCMSAFTPDEIACMTGERRLARIATVGADGTPPVMPVGWTYNQELDTIDVVGRDFGTAKKYCDVAHSGLAAIVIDDVVPPWQPRGIEVRGRAQAVRGAQPMIRMAPGSHPLQGVVSRVTPPRSQEVRKVPGLVRLRRHDESWPPEGGAEQKAGDGLICYWLFVRGPLGRGFNLLRRAERAQHEAHRADRDRCQDEHCSHELLLLVLQVLSSRVQLSA
ncbi:MAG: PPOX class F420-dependent oxidoreductase [Candidatus Dormibacteraceae bacterium]